MIIKSQFTIWKTKISLVNCKINVPMIQKLIEQEKLLKNLILKTEKNQLNYT